MAIEPSEEYSNLLSHAWDISGRYLLRLITSVLVRPFYLTVWWGGAEVHDVCASLTTVGARHWMENSVECTRRIEAELERFGTMLLLLTLLALLFSLLHTLWWRWCVLRPTMRAIKSVFGDLALTLPTETPKQYLQLIQTAPIKGDVSQNTTSLLSVAK